MAAESTLGVSTEAGTLPGVAMQQQHTPGVETLGDDGEPLESKLAVSGVVQAEQHQKRSPTVTSAQPILLLLDEPDMVDGDVFGVAVRPKPLVMK